MESSGQSTRSQEERERDRAERERRRAARAQEAPAPPPPLPPPLQPPPPPAQTPFTPPAPAAAARPELQPQAPRSARRPPSARALVVLALGLLVLAGASWLAIHRLARSPAPRPAPLTTRAVVRVLIPEGQTRAQIALRARAAGLRGSYLAAAQQHSPVLDPARYGAPPGRPNLEGFLFPATYELYRGDPAARLVHEQLLAFTERFGDRQVRAARALGLTPYKLLIVASIVEREAELPGDRAKVAAVVYNRLRAGMELGIDATIRYALNDYAKPLTAAQLALRSPYNTRLHRGLPPTPISNPGMAAIEAAAHPAHAGYLYYVADASGCGDLLFSTSEARFEHDAGAYREALQANGGRVPACHGR